MFLVLWEFEVKPGREQRFQEVYGPGGDWDSLFRSDPNHAETRLFQDTTRSGVYLTADYWLSRKAYEAFLELRRSEYKALDAATEDLTLSERQIGSLETDTACRNRAQHAAPLQNLFNCATTMLPSHRRQDQV